MKIEISKTSEFCLGVKRAINLTLNATKKSKDPIFTLGSIIHNPQVIDLLKKQNIQKLDNITSKKNGTIIIRAHGIPPSIKLKLKYSDYMVVDATCPYVSNLQKIVKKYSNKNYIIIIVGNGNHPEVLGLIGYVASKYHIINNADNIKKLPIFNKAIVVFQTTQDLILYKKIKKIIYDNYPHYKLYNTICFSTKKRQIDIKPLAFGTDMIIVVGGKKSGNTKRLKKIAKIYNKIVLSIQSEKELLNFNWVISAKKIGIIGGASTPDWVIRQLYKVIKKMITNNR